MLYKTDKNKWCRKCPQCDREIIYKDLQTARSQDVREKVCKPCKYGKLTGYIYGLYATDEPLQIRYVGATDDSLDIRLSQHKSQSRCKPHYPVSKWIIDVNARQEYIKARLLGEYPFSELPQSEKIWMDFWKCFCKLLNTNKINDTKYSHSHLTDYQIFW